MARRSDHTRDELHGLILAKAREIVEQGGPAALTARRVAEAVGYSPGTLYNLFANLDDLVVHLNGRTLAALEEALDRRPLTGNAEADLLAQAEAYMGFVRDNARLWALLFDYRLAEGYELPDWFGEAIRRLLGRVESALAPLFGPGEEARRAEAALVLWTGLHGIAALATGGKLEVVADRPAEALVRSLVGNYVKGLKA